MSSEGNFRDNPYATCFPVAYRSKQFLDPLGLVDFPACLKIQWRIRLSVFPCSTSFIKPDAFFRKSVNGTVFMVASIMYTILYIMEGILLND